MTPARAAVAVLLVVALAACGSDDDGPSTRPSGQSSPSLATPTSPTTTPRTSPTPPPATGSGEPEVSDVVATGLAVPWGLDFLPEGDAIVTERDTRRVLRVSPAGVVTELGVVDEAAPEGEGGLLGVAVSPTFTRDQALYLYVTTATDNRVIRVRLDGDRLTTPEVLLAGIPRGFTHDGGRLAFGPDGFLYVSTGESGEPPLAQDRSSLAGKILRLTPDGAPAPGNPFGDEIWSYGHRNVQGLAFDADDRLWASEFGQDTFDELNLIEPGANYGWPEVEGTGGEPEFVDPVHTWDVDDASPSGLAFQDGALWMAALRGERLWRIPVDGEPEGYFVGRYGRMRTVAAAPDGSLWVTTSNKDGRGAPAEEDDQILRVTP